MSYAVKAAKRVVTRRGHRGDPGLFGDIGKFLGGAVKGVVGGVLTGNPLGAISGGILGGINAVRGAQATSSAGKPLNPSILKASAGIPALAPDDGLSQIGLVNINRGQVPMLPMQDGRGNRTQSQGADWDMGSKNGAPCQAGYHKNKSGYYSQRYGWVPAGTVCVRNRKRNPLNPRALSRSLARLHSAKKAVRALRIGDKPRSSAPARKGGCGCKGRR